MIMVISIWETTMTRLWIFVAVMILAAGPARAQTRGNLYAVYSFLSNDLHIHEQLGSSAEPTASGRGKLNGWSVSGEIRIFHWIGAVADFNGSYGSVPATGYNPFYYKSPMQNLDTTFYSYLFGPRVSVEIGRLRPFAEGFVGVASQHVDLTAFDSAQDSHLATAFGGGLDTRVSRRFAWRVQADYVGTRLFHGLQRGLSTPLQANFRISTGLVFRL